MSEHFAATTVLGAIIPASAQGTVIVVLAMIAAVLLLLVIALHRRMTLRVGKLVLSPHQDPRRSSGSPAPDSFERHRRRHRSARAPMPSPPDLNGDSSVHTLDELASASERVPEPTQPFDLAAVAEAVSASETMRAIEALRAVEARRQPGGDSFPAASVRSFKMPVCPLFILYEVSGSSPRVHVIPSDLRSVEVGRSPECAVYSPNPSVSQRHFRMVITPGGATSGQPDYSVELEDCGSRNGTWVNHKRVQGEHRKKMRDGDIIEAASSRYLFYYIMRPE